MDRAEALLPCPFCGCADLHGFTHHSGEESYGFQCAECWMTGPQFGTRAEAVAAWNTRAQAPAPEVLEALTALLPAVDAYMMTGEGLGRRLKAAVWERDIARARAAIAKATSQQPQASPGNRKDGSSNLTAQGEQS